MVQFINLPYVYDLIQQKICVKVLNASNHPASPGTDYRDISWRNRRPRLTTQRGGGPNRGLRTLTRTRPNLSLHKRRGASGGAMVGDLPRNFILTGPPGGSGGRAVASCPGLASCCRHHSGRISASASSSSSSRVVSLPNRS